jgi:PAS domain S-box-containing protein
MYALELITLEILFISLVIILLYHLKGYYGLPLIYIFIGSNQYLQAILASTLYLPIGGDIIVSPGSVVMFSSSFFAILLVYLKADVAQTRTMIYGIVLSNVTLTILSGITNLQMGLKDAINLVGIPPALFTMDARLFLVGTATLFIDAFMIIVLYEFLFFKIPRLGLLGRILGTLLGILYFDAMVFTVGTFWGTPQFRNVLTSQLIGKTYAGLLYGFILYGYLVFIDRKQYLKTTTGPQELRDIFNILTYREKYEYIKTQKELTDKKLQLSEGKWESLVQNVPDIILTVDKKGLIHYLNRPFNGISLQEMKSFSLLSHIEPEYHPEIKRALEKAFQTNQTCTCEFSIVSSNQNKVWYLGRIGPIPEQASHDTAICILTDITPLKQAETERERLHDELAQKQKMAAIGETIEGIAHSMKNIFTPLSASIEIIYNGLVDKDWTLVESSMKILRSSSHHLYLLFMNMLDYSKTREPYFKEFPIQPVFKEVTEMLQSSTGQKKITIEYQVEPGAETFYSDPGKINRALMNLGMNSIDAIKENGWVRITAKRLKAGSMVNENHYLQEESLIIEFSDNGDGLPEEYKEKIFTPFASTKGSRGTGLGLCTVNQFMEEQKGKILFASQPGKGTVFYLIFPQKNRG